MTALSQRNESHLPGQALPENVVHRLWSRMAEVYGQKWTSAFGVDATTGAGATWAKGLAGISAAQIGAGIAAAMSSADPWPPSLPQFRALCLGIPDFAVVQYELRTPASERTPFARLVWSYVDGWKMRQASTQESERMLRDAYGIAREHVMRGGEMPEPPIAAIVEERKQREPASPEIVEKHMRNLTAMFGGCDEA